jgi:hypothetical protein
VCCCEVGVLAWLGSGRVLGAVVLLRRPTPRASHVPRPTPLCVAACLVCVLCAHAPPAHRRRR